MRIDCLKDHAHAALAEQTQHPIMRQPAHFVGAVGGGQKRK